MFDVSRSSDSFRREPALLFAFRRANRRTRWPMRANKSRSAARAVRLSWRGRRLSSSIMLRVRALHPAPRRCRRQAKRQRQRNRRSKSRAVRITRSHSLSRSSSVVTRQSRNLGHSRLYLPLKRSHRRRATDCWPCRPRFASRDSAHPRPLPSRNRAVRVRSCDAQYK